MIQMILKVDKDYQLPISNVGKLNGTKSYYGKILVLAATTEEAIKELNKGVVDELTGEYTQEPANIVIMAREDEPVDQESMLPFFCDLSIYDEETDEHIVMPIEDLTGKIQTLAGRQWQY